MPNLTMHSPNHFAELARLQNLTCATSTIALQELTLNWQCKHTMLVMQAIIHILHRILLINNPVYKNSKLLCSVSQGIFHTNIYRQQCMHLLHYIQHCEMLNIESYILFCMGGYSASLDAMLYKLVKNTNKH